MPDNTDFRHPPATSTINFVRPARVGRWSTFRTGVWTWVVARSRMSRHRHSVPHLPWHSCAAPTTYLDDKDSGGGTQRALATSPLMTCGSSSSSAQASGLRPRAVVARADSEHATSLITCPVRRRSGQGTGIQRFSTRTISTRTIRCPSCSSSARSSTHLEHLVHSPCAGTLKDAMHPC